jgi:hypothetical protein
MNFALPKVISPGYSSPIKPSAPSFLTSFAAEIRNAIYAPLFGHEREWEHAGDDFFGEEETSGNILRHTLPFVRTCRQVYHEALSYWFTENKFFLTSAPCRTTDVITSWSGGMGSQMQMLRNVTISTDALLLRPNTAGYELLPLLRVLWATRATKLQVIINNDEISFNSHYCYHLDTLNTVLELIGRQDILGLERHARTSPF